MKKRVFASMVMAGLALNAAAAEKEQVRSLSVESFRNHLKGGWIDPTPARYVKLVVTKPGSDGQIRIASFQVFADTSATGNK